MVETYGVDMSNFKYWIPGPVEMYTTPNPESARLQQHLDEIASEVEKYLNALSAVKQLKSSSQAILSLDVGSLGKELVEKIKNDEQCINTTIDEINKRYLATVGEFAHLKASIDAIKATNEFMLAYLDSYKFYYVFFHADNKYRMKICREGIKFVSAALILHDKVVVSASNKGQSLPAKTRLFADDEFSVGLRSILKQLKTIKKLAEMTGSMERLESVSEKDRGVSFTEHVAHFESPEAKARHDKQTAEFFAGLESLDDN